MKINTLSIVGLVSGFLFAFLSGLRYFVIWPDTDRAIVYVIIGGLIMLYSWERDKRIKLENTLYDLEAYVAEKPWKNS